MELSNTKDNKNKLRVIKTARDIESINEAVTNGFKPIVKKVEPSFLIRSKYAVLQDKKTGEVIVISDFRFGSMTYVDLDAYDRVIDWTFYYPHSFKSPFAAYLIPKDIAVGERVYVEDLIEDFVGATWNQGDTYRLKSCEAIWTGTELEIQYNPDLHCSSLIG